MNKERMLELAELLKNIPEKKFTMERWLNHPDNSKDQYGNYIESSDSFLYEPLNCGTTGCIAGWAVMLENEFKPVSLLKDGLNIQERASAWLGLTEDESSNLFFTGTDAIWSILVIDYGLDLDYDPYEHSFGSMTNKQVSEAISFIVDNDLELAECDKYCPDDLAYHLDLGE